MGDNLWEHLIGPRRSIAMSEVSDFLFIKTGRTPALDECMEYIEEHRAEYLPPNGNNLPSRDA